MKNKRLIWTLVFLAILTLGSIGTDLFKKEHQDANKVVKVGILQFVPWIKSRRELRMALRKLVIRGTRLKSPS